jgi:hypothetical protein
MLMEHFLCDDVEGKRNMCEKNKYIPLNQNCDFLD